MNSFDIAHVQPADRPCTSFDDIYKTYGELVRSKLRRRDIDPAVAEELHQEVFLTVSIEIRDSKPLDSRVAGRAPSEPPTISISRRRATEGEERSSQGGGEAGR